MKQQITIQDISVLDKKMMLQAINDLGSVTLTCYRCEDQRNRRLPHFLKYSICQNLVGVLTKKLNTPKMWGMEQKEQLMQDKKLTWATYQVIILMEALNTYRYTATDYERARIDQINQQIDKQLV